MSNISVYTRIFIFFPKGPNFYKFSKGPGNRLDVNRNQSIHAAGSHSEILHHRQLCALAVYALIIRAFSIHPQEDVMRKYVFRFEMKRRARPDALPVRKLHVFSRHGERLVADLVELDGSCDPIPAIRQEMARLGVRSEDRRDCVVHDIVRGHATRVFGR